MNRLERPPLAGGDETVRTSDGEIRLWDETFDVVVVGFGAAGASAAIEASRAGASVLVVDRFGGGGATRLSGGVVYAGGGTKLQRHAGYEDTPEEMAKYLELETRGEVSAEVLRTFCEQSRENFEWLCDLGAPFPPGSTPKKTSYPVGDCTLYFSGNETAAPYREVARPAPRGHRALGKGLTGKNLFAALERATKACSTVRSRCRATRLVVDSHSIVGVELSELAGKSARAIHAIGFWLATYLGAVHRGIAALAERFLDRLEERRSVRRFIRARSGVVLATGGFAFDAAMLRQHAPRHAENSMRLGTASDVGDGIRLALSVGAAVGSMERCCAFRFIDPASVLAGGLLLDRRGERICNEELYGASIAEALARPEHGGRGWLVVDARQVAAARRRLWSETMGLAARVFGFVNLYLNHRTARSLAALGASCGMPPGALERAVERYNVGAARGVDELGKSGGKLAAIFEAPYMAINVDLGNPLFLTPTMTLGGLATDAFSGRLLRDDRSEIPGLYAAGRTAVGIASAAYVSGLSIADCVFSGRNAGRDAALRADESLAA